MTWPVAPHIATYVAGEGGDPWQTLWRFEEKARGGSALFYQDVFGQGEPRLANLSVWPWMPLYMMLGQPIAYNSIWLLSFVLSGYAMYLLVHCLTASQKRDHASRGTRYAVLENAPAFLAGLYYMFLPYHAAHALGHFGAMQTQWLPFIILVALMWWRRPTIAKTVLLGILVTIQAWTEHHYLLWLIIFAVFTALFYRRELVQQLRLKTQNSKYKIQTLILAIIVFLGVVLPYVPTARLALSKNTPLELGQQQLIRFSADVFSFVTPASFHPLWGKPVDSVFASNFTGNVVEATQYLGIVTLLLLTFFHRSIPQRTKLFWGSTALLFAIIALGPRLHLFGTVTGIPLPYALVDSLPGIASIRAVARAGVMTGLAVAVLLGYVLHKELRRREVAAVVAMIILVGFLFIPMPTQSARLSAAYQTLAKHSGKTVIEIPAATNYVAASRALYASQLHGKEVVANIALERAQDPADVAEVKALPAIKQLLFLRMTDLRERRTEFFDQDLAETLPDALEWIDAAGIIIHTDSISALQRATLLRFLDMQPNLSGFVYDDVVLYVPNNVSTQSDGVFLVRDSRWQLVGYDPERAATFGEIPDETAVTLINVTPEARRVTLITPLAPESQSGVEMTGESGPIASGVPFTLPPGAHTVTMRATSDAKAVLINPRLVVQ